MLPEVWVAWESKERLYSRRIHPLLPEVQVAWEAKKMSYRRRVHPVLSEVRVGRALAWIARVVGSTPTVGNF